KGNLRPSAKNLITTTNPCSRPMGSDSRSHSTRTSGCTSSRDTWTRLTFDGSNRFPIWTPDGEKITYAHFANAGWPNMYWVRADGAGSPLRLTDGRSRAVPSSWHPSGKLLVFEQNMPDGKRGAFTMTVEGDETRGWKPGEIKPLSISSYAELGWSFSPD